MARRNTEGDTKESQTEATTEASAEAEVEVDLSGFESVVKAAVKVSDDATGEVPEAELAKANEQYRALDGLKPKNAARAYLDKAMMDAIFAQDAPRARSMAQIKENLSAGSSGGSKAPKDPTEAFVAKAASLQAAFNLLFESVPEGVDEGWQEKAEAKATELTTAATDYKKNLAADENFDDSEIPSEVKRVVKLASGRASGGGSYSGGPRRNVNKHIEQVFADLEVGAFLSVTEIHKAESEEYGSDGGPTTGAISQKLFPKSGEPSLPEGIEAVADQKPRGARKVAVSASASASA